MDIETIKSMLRKADPKSNPSAYERRTALTMAQREMDKNGWSYASLGFSQEDAERIANQFAVGTWGGTKREEPKRESRPINIFHGRKTSNRTSAYAEPIYKAPKPKKSEKHERYEEQCERRDRANFDKWYEGFVSYQKSEQVKAHEEAQYMNKVMAVVLIALVLIMIFTVVFVERAM